MCSLHSTWRGQRMRSLRVYNTSTQNKAVRERRSRWQGQPTWRPHVILRYTSGSTETTFPPLTPRPLRSAAYAAVTPLPSTTTTSTYAIGGARGQTRKRQDDVANGSGEGLKKHPQKSTWSKLLTFTDEVHFFSLVLAVVLDLSDHMPIRFHFFSSIKDPYSKNAKSRHSSQSSSLRTFRFQQHIIFWWCVKKLADVHISSSQSDTFYSREVTRLSSACIACTVGKCSRQNVLLVSSLWTVWVDPESLAAASANEVCHKAQPQFFINSALAENKSFLFF